jgi:hypothetical protein
MDGTDGTDLICHEKAQKNTKKLTTDFTDFTDSFSHEKASAPP